jgi:cell wall-associated NlpC family hydrolase
MLAACGSQPPLSVPAPQVASERDALKAALFQQQRAWQGVPYRMGGLSRQGIDCSGFVHLTYRDLFGIDLPRHTAVQANVGETVPRTALETGDLVFFRTGSTRHVGIYVDQGMFLHASTSSGVMLSSLSDAYWARRFWRAVRVPGLARQR